MRRLIHIPILHNAADLGSLSDSVRAQYAKVLGESGWTWRQQAVERLWQDIRANIHALRLNYAKTRIYQDGLPVCGFELQIVRELAQAGSCNHQLLLELLDKGATLMGTEDSQLLIREYRLHQGHAQGRTPPDATPGQAPDEAQSLLEARDEFIARRIDETLQAGETGVLFLGAAHRLDRLRATDIQVTCGGYQFISAASSQWA